MKHLFLLIALFFTVSANASPTAYAYKISGTEFVGFGTFDDPHAAAAYLRSDGGTSHGGQYSCGASGACWRVYEEWGTPIPTNNQGQGYFYTEEDLINYGQTDACDDPDNTHEYCPQPEEPEEPEQPPLQCTAPEQPNEDGSACECPVNTLGCEDSPTDFIDCEDRGSCRQAAEQQCAADGQILTEFQYLGAGDKSYSCGDSNRSCDAGYSFNIPTQNCLNDVDADGTPDVFDPDPNDPNVKGDSDGDGIPDQQDTQPNDDANWFGEVSYSGSTGGINYSVDAVGESTNFNDTAIVGALNELIDQGNTTNANIESLESVGIKNNDLTADTNQALNQIDNSLDGISEQLEEKNGDATNAAITGLINSTPEELGIVVPTSSDDVGISSVGAMFANSQCVNPSIGQSTLDVCSIAPHVNSTAEIVLWLILLSFVWNEFHSVLRGQHGG